ncbi:MAG: peptidylprolyl isomerase [Saprospiraceae bacterium]
MAILGAIRQNRWILIVLMTLALGGFILMDIITNAQRYRSGDANTMGKVGDVEIKRTEFDTYEKLIYTNAKDNILQARQQIWNYFVESAMVNEEAEAIGLGVGKDELDDLQYGNNLSPIILERFTGNDGQPNRATLSNIKSSIESGSFTDPTNVAYWNVQQKEVIKERLQTKIVNLASKGVFTPTWMAEMTFKENNQRLSFNYVCVPYSKISDKDAALTDADFEAYLKENPRLHDQTDETRMLEYVTFNVYPTASDSAAAYEAVTKMLAGLREAANDSIYVVSNYGKVESNYRKKDLLPASVADSMLSLPVGTIVGPYQDKGAWAVAKILGRKTTPDSVRARHILIREATPANEKKVDSLMAILNANLVPFDTLAVRNSQDGSASKGGDLGWFSEGAMVPEFNNVCFYEGEQGKYYKVSTQFGWHLIEITGKKFIKNEAGVRAAYLTQPIEPSTETQARVKDKALELLQKAKNRNGLTDLAGKQNLSVQPSQPVTASDFAIGTISGPEVREIIRWAFDPKTEADALCQDVFAFRDPNGGYFDHQYLVTALKSISPKGPATVASLKSTPRTETEVRNRKKADMLKSKLQSAGSLEAIASQWGVKVDTAVGATMLQTYLPTTGAEPRVVGTAFGLGKGKISKPIAGVAGVYVLHVTSDIPDVPLPPDFTMFRRQATSSSVAGIRMNLINIWKKQSEIQDNRSRFF